MGESFPVHIVFQKSELLQLHKFCVVVCRFLGQIVCEWLGLSFMAM